MLLIKPELNNYIIEIEELQKKYLPAVPINKSVIHFGVIENSELLAVATLKCYIGNWQLRACVVKPEYRGRGLQRQLIKERVEYLKGRTNIVRVCALPEKIHSIRNIEAEGFEFEKKKKALNGELLYVYRKKI